MAYTDIDDPSVYFQTTLYTGNGGTNAITNTGNSDLQPDWIWFKRRDGADNNILFDVVRGVTKGIYADLTNPQDNLADSLASFNSDGFTLGADTGSGGSINGNSETMVAWQWKETADAGFDILTYEGTGSIQTEAHNLGVKPDMIMVKNIDSSDPPFNWRVYHSSLGAGVALKLNSTDAISDDPGYWGDTEPTSSVFSIKDSGETNNNNQTYIAYLFAAKQGYSKFGKYTANAIVDGNFIFTGFKPAFILIKSSNEPQAGQSWFIYDSSRDPGNTATQTIQANVNTGEQTNVAPIDILSNGFKLRTNTGRINGSNGEYIYMAFAESPFVTSTGVPTTAR